MKRLLVTLSVVLFLSVSAFADEPQKFSPEKFQAEMEQFITQEACLSPEEAAKFFPLLREMHQKQRAVYHKIRQATKQQPADDKACETTLKECDKLNIELRQVEQTYHLKMMKAIPAKKVYDAIMAENNFHRRMMRGGFQTPTGFNGFQGWQNPFGQQRGKRR